VEIRTLPGSYVVECKGVRYGQDRRVAGMRVFAVGSKAKRGKKIGEIPVDFGGVSVLDIDTVEDSINEDEERYEEWLDEILYDSDDYSSIKIHEWVPTGTKIPVVQGGFGDGVYNVYELMEEGNIVGLEIEFIRDGEEYPFDNE
jgi:hypothetical protein